MWVKFNLWFWKLAAKSPLLFALVSCTFIFSLFTAGVWFIVAYFDKSMANQTASILSAFWAYILIQYVSNTKKEKKYA